MNTRGSIDDEFYTLTSERFASIHGIKPESLRKRLSDQGTYFGVTPRKLPNGRLMWPSVQISVNG